MNSFALETSMYEGMSPRVVLTGELEDESGS
jgi:hypothetical protein